MHVQEPLPYQLHKVKEILKGKAQRLEHPHNNEPVPIRRSMNIFGQQKLQTCTNKKADS